MWTEIRLLLEEQSDQGPHCLPVCKNRFEKFVRIFSRQHKQMKFLDAGLLGILRVNRLTWPVFKLIQAFIPSLLICKVQEDLIKTEWVMLMTVSKIGIFSNQGGCNSKIKNMVWTVFKIHWRLHPCPSYLQISGWSNQNWTSYADDKVKQKLFQQSRGCN